jgi:hypothetical protein
VSDPTTENHLSLEEELVLAPFIPLGDDDRDVCSVRGCLERADVIVPGAVLCRACAAGFLLRDGRYDIPLDEIPGGPELREARRQDYRERLVAVRETDGGLRRTRAAEERLRRIIEARVDDFIVEAGALP